MSRLAFTLVFLLATCASMSACKSDAACRELCLKLGVEPASEMCTLMCTSDCDDFERDFGVSVAKCEAMQRGEL